MKKTSWSLPRVLAVYSLLGFFIPTAFAQGTAFSYQGRLNSGGSPANGRYDYRFKLYADPLGNTQVGGSYTTNAIPVTNGLFTTTIDFGPGIFTGGTNWLEVDVRTNGSGGYTVLSPLQGVTPAPNAIFAETANNLSGTVSAAQISGAVASGNLPSSPTVSGTVTADSFAGNGANVTNVNAAGLNGLGAASFWQLGGNNVAAGQFFGSTNNQPVEIQANGGRALRLEPGGPAAYWGDGIPTGAPNVIGGSPVNFVAAGVVGAVIGGGGATTYGGLSYTNSVAADFGIVAGGGQNTIQSNAFFSMIGGGYHNTIQTNTTQSTIGGGFFNTIQAGAFAANIGGGFENTIQAGDYSTIGGGYLNEILAGGYHSTIPGGSENEAGGSYSFAAGQQARALYTGDFVWADSQNAPFAATAADQFCLRAQGGVHLDNSTSIAFGNQTRQMLELYRDPTSTYIYGMGVQTATFYQRTGSNGGFAWYMGGSHNDAQDNPGGGVTLMTLSQGGGLTVNGTFVSASDRNLKENFQPVSAQEVLQKVAALPVSRWNYKNDAGTAHIGPMAQDFYAAFSVGPDDKHITTVDEGGVALAAIQGLNQKLEEQKTENAALRQQLAELKELVHQLASTQSK